MKFTILTLFPEYFSSILGCSILKRAQSGQSSPIEVEVINIRDFATDKHKVTDDHPYGGGPGMVMKVEPIDRALQSIPHTPKHNSKIILTSAKGKLFTQETAASYSKLDELVIVCGHYEGVDERVAQHLVDEEIRIGNFVMTGGESAASVILDTTARLIPGVLGNDESPVNESHSNPGYLEHPQYTRPEKYRGWKVPQVLLGGNHALIKKWQEENTKQE